MVNMRLDYVSAIFVFFGSSPNLMQSINYADYSWAESRLAFNAFGFGALVFCYRSAGACAGLAACPVPAACQVLKSTFFGISEPTSQEDPDFALGTPAPSPKSSDARCSREALKCPQPECCQTYVLNTKVDPHRLLLLALPFTSAS